MPRRCQERAGTAGLSASRTYLPMLGVSQPGLRTWEGPSGPQLEWGRSPQVGRPWWLGMTQYPSERDCCFLDVLQTPDQQIDVGLGEPVQELPPAANVIDWLLKQRGRHTNRSCISICCQNYLYKVYFQRSHMENEEYKYKIVSK